MFYPHTLMGTDFHTTMINGWGVDGIEAEADMLGQPVIFFYESLFTDKGDVTPKAPVCFQQVLV